MGKIRNEYYGSYFEKQEIIQHYIHSRYIKKKGSGFIGDGFESVSGLISVHILKGKTGYNRYQEAVEAKLEGISNLDDLNPMEYADALSLVCTSTDTLQPFIG